MRTSAVEEIQILSDTGFCMRYRFVGVQVDVFIFQTSPQPFDEHVVNPAAFAVHADFDLVLLERIRERVGGELLICISHDLI